MARLNIYLLGAPRIEHDGQPVEPDTRKAIALLAYLAVTGKRHTRDALATLLWPEFDQIRGRAALRRTLSALKSALEGYGLAIQRDSLGLDPAADIWADVGNFHELLAECSTHGHPADEACPNCLEPLMKAIDLYDSDFMAGFSLRDSVDFDDWQYLQAEELRREMARALDNLGQCHAQLDDYETAINYARRLLQLDPLRESAHRQLMTFFTLNGQRSAALRQYRSCVRTLEEELGVPPLEETTKLYERILAGQIEAPPTKRLETTQGTDEDLPSFSSFSPHPDPTSFHDRLTTAQLPLVGRTNEWLTMVDWYGGVQAGGRLLVLEGEAGIGKTRLAQDFLAYARQQGATTVTAQCYQGESSLAYSPFIEGLSEIIAAAGAGDRWRALPDFWLAEACRLVPDLIRLKSDLPPPSPLDSPGGQSRFFEAISRLIQALCGQSPPGILFLDDVYWTDEATLDLLAYLLRRLHNHPLLVILTWRAEEVPAGHRLQRMLADAQRAGIGHLITLDRLNELQVKQLLQTVPVTTTAEDAFFHRLYNETEGLPFFLAEYLAMLTTDVGLEGPAGTFDPAILDSLPRPDNVRDLLRSRLAIVSETALQLLHTAAVIGRSVDFDILREASGRDEEETIFALEELLARSLVVERMADNSKKDPAAGSRSVPISPIYDFNHEQLRALVYEETSFARRRLLHRRVAQALIAGRRDAARFDYGTASAAVIAHHFQQAGDEENAAAYFKQAGDESRTLYANAEALAHYQTALALGYHEPVILHEAIADLHTLRGEYDEALNAYESAAALLERSDAPGDLPRLEHNIGNIYQRLGEWELAFGHYRVALETMSDRGQQARLLTDWSLTAHHAGEGEQAAELAGRALDRAQEADDLQALAQANNVLGILAKSRGELMEAQQRLENGLEMAECLRDPGVTIATLNNLALIYSATGDTGRALELAGRALDLCLEFGDRHREAALHNNLADILHASGRSEEAMDHLKQAVAIYADIGADTGGDISEWRPEIWKLSEW